MHDRVEALVAERERNEREASSGSTTLVVRKREIVERECTGDLVASSWRSRGPRGGEAADAGRADGSRVSLDAQG